MVLDLATAVQFNRNLTCVPKCALTSKLWDEVDPVDLATLVVACMSDASVAYISGKGSIAAVESASSHKGPGIYELSQSFDALRQGTYIGKTDTNMSLRINCHRSAAKTKKSTLYRAIRAFRDRPYYELLLVKLPSNDPYSFLRLWRYLCPKTAAKTSVEPEAKDVRATFISLIEASFIALRRTFRLDEDYSIEGNEVFGNPSGVGLNGTSGTKVSVNRTRGSAPARDSSSWWRERCPRRGMWSSKA